MLESLKKKRKSKSKKDSQFKKNLKETTSYFSKEAQDFRVIFIRNIMITITAGFFLILLLPYLARYVYTELWIYAHENVVVHVNLEEIYAREDQHGLTIFEGIIKGIVSSLVGRFLGEVRWLLSYVARVVRFAYLVILTTMAFYLLLFFILSLIMQNKVKIRAVFISIVLSCFSSFAIAYFLVPNNQEMMIMFVDVIKQLLASPDIMDDLPMLIMDIIYTFYFGFLIMVLVNLFLASGVEYILNKW